MSNQQESKRNENEIGGLWKNVSKAGVTYYSGSVDLDQLAKQGVTEGKAKIVVFEKKWKDGTPENAPSHSILISKPRDGGASSPTPAPEQSQGSGGSNSDGRDDVPF